MASIIKNQILKYLSRYFKNLSPDKINFNTIKGEGEITALELDEIALTDLLELPAWMRITSAKCNKVKFQIPWTRLKSEPMVWNLDEVKVKIETCEELRTPDEAFTNLLQSPGKYNFIIKTVDGMTINVNTVSIDFSSAIFVASLQILRIEVESKSSAWEKCDLRHTRIKDLKRGQILLFKEVRWQNLRIEAKSITEKELPPLRLLTNDAVCRIIIKKRLSDCFIMGSKLVLILRQLLWVLTDSQLKAALHFLDSLSGLIKKADEVVRKKKAARKLEVLPEYQAQVSQQEAMQGKKSAVSHLFSCHDVVETSYHIIAQKVNLHLSDDPGPERSTHPELQNGASIHIELSSFQVDYYPYHLAVKDRNHWGLYKMSRYPHPQWLLQSQNEFRNSLLSLVEDDFSSSSSPPHANIHENGVSYHSSPSKNYNLRHYLQTQFNKIMTSCTVLRIADFFVHKVTSTSKKDVPKEFIKTDRDRYKLPETEIIHAEFTYYYYPGDMQFPLPPPKFYVQIYPVQIQFDMITIIWLNTFFLNLHKSLLTTSTAQNEQLGSQLFYFDVKLEITMPQIVFETNEEKALPKDKPRTFQLEISKISITNTRTNGGVSSRSNLAKVVNSCQMKNLFLNDRFPSKSTDYRVVTDKFIKHVQGKDNVRNFPRKLFTTVDDESDISKTLFQELLWVDAKDVWCIHLESIWGDFGGVRAVANSTVPFLDAFPLTVWLHIDPFSKKCDEDRVASVHALASISNLISVQINKYQAAFLTKIMKLFSELTTFLTLDTDRTANDAKTGTVAVASVIPQIEITLVTSPKDAGKESTGDDVESSSFVPDSSSLDANSMYWTNNMSINLEMTVDEVRKNALKSTVSFAANDDSAINSKYKSTDSKPFSQFKKNFSNLMSMDFTSKSLDDASDTISIRSDDSSDTENYLMRSGSDQLYLDDADAMFRINVKKKTRVSTFDFGANVEVADEALAECVPAVGSIPTTPSEKDSSASVMKRKDRVAATTLKLGRLEFMMQSAGLKGSVKMQIENIGVEECFSIPWDELQNKFSSRIRNWNEIEDSKSDFITSPARIKLRLENEIVPPESIDAATYNVNAWRNARLDMVVEDVTLEVQPQTVKCVTEFVEDEKFDLDDKPISFEIFVDNVELLFREEESAAECAAPQVEPAKASRMIFRKLRLWRENEGAIYVQPAAAKAVEQVGRCSTTNNDAERVEAMKTEIELLRKRLAAMHYLREENEALRQCKEETELLRACLVAAQNQVADLLEQQRLMMDRRSAGMRASYASTDNSGAVCKR